MEERVRFQVRVKMLALCSCKQEVDSYRIMYKYHFSANS
jgi:hypothetical protein